MICDGCANNKNSITPLENGKYKIKCRALGDFSIDESHEASFECDRHISDLAFGKPEVAKIKNKPNVRITFNNGMYKDVFVKSANDDGGFEKLIVNILDSYESEKIRLVRVADVFISINDVIAVEKI